MKKFLCALFSFMSSNLSAEIKIEVKVSEAAAYYHYLSSGFDMPFTSGAMKEIIEGSESSNIFRKTEEKRKFQNFSSYLENGYNFESIVGSRPQGVWAEDIFMGLAATSSNLRELEKQMSLLMPYDGVKAYFELKNKFYPFFEKDIWTKTLNKHGKDLRGIEEEINRSGFSDLIERARIFYHSNYPEELPLKVSLIPIPGMGIKNKHTSALNLKDIQIVPYFVGESPKENLDVVFHEFCHALFEAQAKEWQIKIDDFFLNNKDTHARFAYTYFNEALATAWGNGLFVKKLTGSFNDKSWYNVTYIDQIAKAIASSLEEYSDNKKPIDNIFLNDYLEKVKKSFPSGNLELAPNLMAINIFSDQNLISLDSIRSLLRKKFRVQSIKTSGPPIREEDWKRFEEKGIKNFVIVSTNYLNILPRLKKYKININKSNIGSNSLITIPLGGRFIFWFNVDSEEQFILKLNQLNDKAILSNKIEII